MKSKNPDQRRYPSPAIKSLPFSARYRQEAIKLADSTFEMLMRRIDPDNPKETHALWDSAAYVDKHHITEDMLPIDSEYALSLIEAFLSHHVVDLAVQADRMETASN